MNTSRRSFLRQLIGATALVWATTPVASLSNGAPNFLLKRPKRRLGTVTYNLARNWDIETIIKRCTATGFEGVELRTTHRHGVEVGLDADQRKKVRDRFRRSAVDLMGLGSAFDYHTPDAEKLRRDIAATKKYIVLAHDVGAEGVKVRPNGLPRDVPVEKTLEQIGRSLRELGEFGDDYGIQIRLEVHGRGTSRLPNIRTIMDVADHPNVGVCWNCNPTDLDGAGFDHNFDLVKDKIFVLHMRDLFLEKYPFRRLFVRLDEIDFRGYCLAEIPESKDPLRVMRYYRALWLAYQNAL